MLGSYIASVINYFHSRRLKCLCVLFVLTENFEVPIHNDIHIPHLQDHNTVQDKDVLRHPPLQSCCEGWMLTFCPTNQVLLNQHVGTFLSKELWVWMAMTGGNFVPSRWWYTPDPLQWESQGLPGCGLADLNNVCQEILVDLTTSLLGYSPLTRYLWISYSPVNKSKFW